MASMFLVYQIKFTKFPSISSNAKINKWQFHELCIFASAPKTKRNFVDIKFVEKRVSCKLAGSVWCVWNGPLFVISLFVGRTVNSV